MAGMVNSFLFSCQPVREPGEGGLNQGLLGRDDGLGRGCRTEKCCGHHPPPAHLSSVPVPPRLPDERSIKLGREGESPHQALGESGDALGGETLVPEPFSGSLCLPPSHLYSLTPPRVMDPGGAISPPPIICGP